MSTTTTTAQPGSAPSGAARLPREQIRGIGFGTLVRVELRKLTDTLAGRAFLGVIALVLALVLGIMVAVADGEHGLDNYFVATAMPLGVLLPVLGILAATAEWSQRTAMTTFALEPRRGRVISAKIVAMLVMGVLAFVLSLALAAVANGVAVGVLGADSPWTITGGDLGAMLLVLSVGVLQGTAFGFLFLNTPAAIVAYLALPMVFNILTSLIAWMRDVAAWIDVQRTTAPLLEGQGMDTEQWAQLATSLGVWVVLPLSFGVWRVLRAEVK